MDTITTPVIEQSSDTLATIPSSSKPRTGLVPIRKMSLAEMKPAPENDKLYRPVDAADPEIKALAADIERNGIKEPLVLSLDGYILSGHRRHTAAIVAGETTAPYRIEPIRRSDDPDAFLRLLASYNNQRVKSFDEKLREVSVAISADGAYDRLMSARAARSVVNIPALQLGDKRSRAKISPAKQPMLAACLSILERFSAAISDRKIHYELLNDPPLRHASKPKSFYRNDRASYSDLCDLLTRARHEGVIPWEAISDETRPVTIYRVWRDSQAFINEEMNDLLVGYWRDLLQSQPNHIEVIAEKNTVADQIKGVCSKYCLPMTSGRGFCSSKPRWDLKQRYLRSGKERLVLLIVSDLDPAGMVIAESFARSMRDDHEVDVHAIKVAVTGEHIKKYNLPPGEIAKGKETDAIRREFVRRYGEHVYECEALPGNELSRLLDEAVCSVLDIAAFNHEVRREAEDAAHIESTREAARQCLVGIERGGE